MLGSCSIPLGDIGSYGYDRSNDANEGEGAYHTFGITVEPAGMK